MLRVILTGGAGFLGQHVQEVLFSMGLQVFVPRKNFYDLTREQDTRRLYEDFCPDAVIHLAAEVGGIEANRKAPGRFFYSNMSMGLNLVEQGRIYGLGKFIQVGTVCSYPKHCPVPFVEDDIWNGYPEETNAPYGIAKKSLMVMLDSYRIQYGMKSCVLIPCNLYGPGDNFDLESGHVIPGMIRRFCDAARRGEDRVTCWGTGKATREFLYVKDAAEAISKFLFVEDHRPMNLGGGSEVSISSLASVISKLCGFNGVVEWDSSKPDGQPRRFLDCQRVFEVTDWRPKTPLESGLKFTVDWWRGRLG